MIEAQAQLNDALQSYFGFDTFKGRQEEIIRSVLDREDTFVIMPTGGGKSLCYQLPALMMDGTAIVISPLIALMKNQVDSIRGHSESDHVAHFLNSSLNKTQTRQVKEDILDGHTKLLFIAPETLTKDENIEFFKQVPISFVAVDEAHCISEWGHDFRPEYRRIRTMIDSIDQEIPIIALTATATPKVQEDIIKNLNMSHVERFVDSFNRSNLYYEVRPKPSKKQETIKQILQVIKQMPGQSGIIYVQSRKSTEEIAKQLRVNDIKAAPYHAGLDAKTRSKTQDDFLMEEVDVIVATIAFGMGIDKPDVRFVIHYNIPKSIENYYQETGRAGRDGLEGRCVSFFAYKDLLKLEKFLRDKPVAEREMGALLLQEIEAYAETTACRRKFLLHYFGEEFDTADCNDMCDNCRHPKKRIEVKDDMLTALKAVDELKENYAIKNMVDFVRGDLPQDLRDFNFEELPSYAKGSDHDETYWNSIYRHALLKRYLHKDIEKYGVLKLTKAGRAFIENPGSVKIPINHNFEKQIHEMEQAPAPRAVLDSNLMTLLQDLRRSIAREKEIPPFVIFQDPSLEDMATQYPISMSDMTKISGVSRGKANRYGKPFIKLIKEYVEENDIDRPDDFVIKSVAKKSRSKVQIIQAIDRKVPLPDIADTNNMDMDELLNEIDAIVSSGTKVDIDYYINEYVDEYSLEDTYDYFMEADTDSVEAAFEELKEDDVTMEEIRLVRIKFLSEMAN